MSHETVPTTEHHAIVMPLQAVSIVGRLVEQGIHVAVGSPLPESESHYVQLTYGRNIPQTTQALAEPKQAFELVKRLYSEDVYDVTVGSDPAFPDKVLLTWPASIPLYPMPITV